MKYQHVNKVTKPARRDFDNNMALNEKLLEGDKYHCPCVTVLVTYLSRI